jgi:hypothetical protein
LVDDSAPGAADDRVAFLARVAPLFALAYGLLWLLNLDLGRAIPRDGTTLVVGRDFLNFWMAGRAAWGADPQRFYDLATYQSAISKVTGPGYLGQVWSYPPSIMLAAAPFGRLPYLPALALWSAIGPAALYCALRSWVRDRQLLIATLLCPAAMFGLISGQFAFFGTALILTVLRWRHSRPWAAGALLGLLTLKPQLGLFFPLMLLASRNWRVIAAASLSAVAVAALTALLWGPEVWTVYLTQGIATQSRVLSDPDALGGPFMPTIFMNLRSAGVPTGAAFIVQAAASLVAAALILWRFCRVPGENDWSANATFLALALFGTPYLLSYDVLPLTVAILLAMAPGRTGRLLTFAVWLLPLLQLALGSIHVPGPALIPLLAALYLLKQPASSTWVDQRNWPTGRTHSSA